MSNNTTAFKGEMAALIESALKVRMPMLLLRGTDSSARVDGDIDVLVPFGQAEAACRLVADAAVEFGWQLAGFSDIGYLAQVVLVRSGADGYQAVKVDFFSGMEWYGVGTGALSRRFFAEFEVRELNAPELAKLAAIATFIQKCLIVGRLSERDWARVSEHLTPEELLSAVQAVGLPIEAFDISRRGLTGWSQWRLRFASSGHRRAFAWPLWWLQVSLAHTRFKLGLGRRSGHVIGLSGLDGSGKSTQMTRLLGAFRQAAKAEPDQIHLLPEWIPLPHKLLRRRRTETNYTRPYAEPPVRSKLSGRLRLTYYVIAFVLARCWLRLETARGRSFVLDRSFADFAADLGRARIPDFRLPGWLLRLCTPQGVLVFLDVQPEQVVLRKGELLLDKAKDLRARYLTLFKRIGGRVVDGNGPPDEVSRRILHCVDSTLRERVGWAESR